MTKEERIENWQRTIAEQEAIGMTPRAFCLNKDINLGVSIAGAAVYASTLAADSCSCSRPKIDGVPEPIPASGST